MFTSKSGGPGWSCSVCVSHCVAGPAPSPLSSPPGRTASARVAVSPPCALWESPRLLAQKHRGQDIFSLQSVGVQTIRSLKPLIAQVREGKVTAGQEGSSCLTGSGPLGHSRSAALSRQGCLWKVTSHVCARTWPHPGSQSCPLPAAGLRGKGASSGIESQYCVLFVLNHAALNFKMNSFLSCGGSHFGWIS